MTAANIRRFRKRLKLTQSALAALVGRSQGSVADWETGRRKPDGASIILLKMLLTPVTAKR